VPVPTIVPRREHSISRRDVDPEALKVLYRLHEHKYLAYLVGGSVRDLLLGRQPKDFDVATDAHPYQIKKLFRNCWIIGRRFRLAHVKFGPKTIEVATFRRVLPEASSELVDTGAADPDAANSVVVASAPEATADAGAVHRDNTFGTPEEDAFRRDFTINGLFYDISTFSIIDYVGGLGDLQKGIVRSIGDPRIRFVEDPVRMLRAVVMATRLGFEMDPIVAEAIAEHRKLLATASPARLLEEYYKILRSGVAEATFRALGQSGLLELITPELKNAPDAVWESLARIDRYRRQFPAAPPTLTNTVLIGALLAPLGALARRRGSPAEGNRERVEFGILPVARKDLERQQQIVQMLPRLTDPGLPPRIVRGLVHRPVFPDALVWLEVFGDAPEHLARWREAHLLRETAPRAAGGADGVAASRSASDPHHSRRTHPVGHPHGQGPAHHGGDDDGSGPAPRRRRRRRRRRRPGPTT
jgi:poly(A) polymerase